MSRMLPLVILVCSLVSACASTGNSDDNVYDVAFNADKAYAQSQWSVAEPLYTRLTKLVPDDPRAYFRLGNCYLRQGKLNQSVSSYRAAIFRNPENAKFYNNLAVAHILQARKALSTSIAKAGDADLFIGNASRMLGSLDKAVSKQAARKSGRDYKRSSNR